LVQTAKVNNRYKDELKKYISNFIVQKNKENGEG